MRAWRVGPPLAGALRETLLAGVLCNDAALSERDGVWEIAATRPRRGCWSRRARTGLDEKTLQSVFPRLDLLPFDWRRSTWRRRTRSRASGVDRRVKGSVERLRALRRHARRRRRAGDA